MSSLSAGRLEILTNMANDVTMKMPVAVEYSPEASGRYGLLT